MNHPVNLYTPLIVYDIAICKEYVVNFSTDYFSYRFFEFIIIFRTNAGFYHFVQTSTTICINTVSILI